MAFWGASAHGLGGVFPARRVVVADAKTLKRMEGSGLPVAIAGDPPRTGSAGDAAEAAAVVGVVASARGDARARFSVLVAVAMAGVAAGGVVAKEPFGGA